MSAQTHGTAHLFGIQGGVAVVTNATVVSFSLKSTPNNRSDTMNEIGNTIEVRLDDIKKTGTLSLIPRSGFTAPTVGAVYTYNSVKFMVISEGREEKNGDKVMLTYDIESNEYITLA